MFQKDHEVAPRGESRAVGLRETVNAACLQPQKERNPMITAATLALRIYRQVKQCPIPVERDGKRVYDSWTLFCVQTARLELSQQLGSVDRSAFAAKWEELVSMDDAVRNAEFCGELSPESMRPTAY